MDALGLRPARLACLAGGRALLAWRAWLEVGGKIKQPLGVPFSHSKLPPSLKLRRTGRRIGPRNAEVGMRKGERKYSCFIV